MRAMEEPEDNTRTTTITFPNYFSCRVERSVQKRSTGVLVAHASACHFQGKDALVRLGVDNLTAFTTPSRRDRHAASARPQAPVLRVPPGHGSCIGEVPTTVRVRRDWVNGNGQTALIVEPCKPRRYDLRSTDNGEPKRLPEDGGTDVLLQICRLGDWVKADDIF